jgi:predicted DNA-binding transcriptional regulator YafY
MNRIDRLTAILIHLQSKRVIKAQEIAERFDISIRTVYRDIRALEEAGVPIGAQAGHGYYIVEGYHLPPVMFTQEEAGSMLIGGKLIQRFADESVKKQFESALFKIRSVLEDADKDYVDNLNSRIEIPSNSPLENPPENEELLSDLQLMVGRGRMVEIDYHSAYKDETTTRLVEPLGLCYWGNHWHLIAFCTMRKDYRDFRLSRLKKMTPTSMYYNAERHESLQTLVQNMLKTEKLKPATVRFDPSVTDAIQEQKYYFGFVEERSVSGAIEMAFLSSSYQYLSNWLITFSDQVEIVSPESLKELLKNQAQKLHRHYC